MAENIVNINHERNHWIFLSQAEQEARTRAKEAQRKAEEAAKKDPDRSPARMVHHHDPKYKFKQLKQPKYEVEGSRNTSSPNPPTPVKNNQSHSSAASAADSNPLRRMRKKELLNQYYGIELPPQAPPVALPASNGPLMDI